MPERIKVGMILQPQAAHWTGYMDILSRLGEVISVAVADETGKTFEPAKQRIGAKLGGLYRDTREMLKQEHPEMALVSLEPADAPANIEAALEAGCHVLAEKPACVREEDFVRLVEKARGQGRQLMLAFAMRRRPMVEDARRLVQEGCFGRLYGVDTYFIADQTRVAQKEQQESWFFQKARGGGGHLIWLGCHFIDLLQYVLGVKIVEVASFTGVVGGQPVEVEDSAAVLFRFSNGMLGTLTSGYYLDKGKQSSFALWGEHGWLRMWPLEKDCLEWYGTSLKEASARKQTMEYAAEKDGYHNFVHSAVRAAAGLEPPPIKSEEGLHVLKTIFAAYRAAETGQAQKVD